MHTLCTVATKAQWGRVRILVQSFLDQHPEGKVYVLPVDGKPDNSLNSNRVKIISSEKLEGFLPVQSLLFEHNAWELTCLLRPAFLEYLLTNESIESITYLDPQAWIAGSLDKLKVIEKTHPIALLPQISQPGFDPLDPREFQTLHQGSFDSGFLHLANHKTSLLFLKWWKEKFKTPHTYGFRWLDLVPGLFESVFVLRDPQYGLGARNLKERHVTFENGKYLVNGKPLVYINFAHLDVEQTPPFSPSAETLKKIFAEHRKRLAESNSSDYLRLPYGYAHFDNGMHINPFLREIYKSLHPSEKKRFENPFETKAGSFFQWLWAPDKNGIPPLILHMREKRPDIRESFPKLDKPTAEALVKWAVDFGIQEFNLDPGFKQILEFANVKEQFANKFLQGMKQKTPKKEPAYFGVNLSGLFNSEKGLGTAVRADLQCLNAGKIKYVLNNISDIGSKNVLRLENQQFSLDNPFPINFVHVNADSLSEFIARKGTDYFKGKYNIGYWVWETEHFPNEWKKFFAYFNEIWTPSRFSQQAIGKTSPIPVFCAPHCVEPTPSPRMSQFQLKKKFGMSPDCYTFLFMFDFHSFMSRKNPDGLIKAFAKEFKRSEKAQLVIKCSHSESKSEELAHLKSLAAKANVKIIDSVLNAQDTSLLFHACDTYVSLHRSEGFGLTMAEAMAIGKPTIATAYSGNMDFMTPFNSHLVPYTKVQVTDYLGSRDQNVYWAEPNLSVAGALMREVYEDREGALRMARTGATDIKNSLGVKVVSKIYRERLEAALDPMISEHSSNKNLEVLAQLLSDTGQSLIN